MTGPSFDRVVDALTAVSKITKHHDGDVMAQCPAHEDGHASLHVTYAATSERVMVHCHAGCRADAVVTALSLTMSELFDDHGQARDEVAAASPRRVTASYPYYLPGGEIYLWKDRIEGGGESKSFVQRLPGSEPGKSTGLGGLKQCLYRLPELQAAMLRGEEIWIVEGEKDVHTAERHGLVATTGSGGAGKWPDYYSDFIAKFNPPRVVIVADQDKRKADGTLGPGHQHAMNVRESLRSQGITVRVVAPAYGKDLTDHFTAGYQVKDFVSDPAVVVRPRGVTGDVLMEQEFPPILWAVDALIPEGLTILAGSPKSGKSWISLSMALAVASGGKACGDLQCRQGDVLYLAREDGDRRLQSRIDLVASYDDPALFSRLELVSAEVPWMGGTQGLASMTEWAENVESPRLVVIDTLAKLESGMDHGSQNAYQAEYDMLSRYKRWADAHRCSVVLVHHTRKAKSESGDPFDDISGSKAMTGVADALLLLKSERGSEEGMLHVDGRDVVGQEIGLRKVGPLWQAFDPVIQPYVTKARKRR